MFEKRPHKMAIDPFCRSELQPFHSRANSLPRGKSSNKNIL